MSSTRRLGEAFQESEVRSEHDSAALARNLNDIERRLVQVEAQLSKVRDLSLALQRGQASALPVQPATANHVIPALNIPVGMIRGLRVCPCLAGAFLSALFNHSTNTEW